MIPESIGRELVHAVDAKAAFLISYQSWFAVGTSIPVVGLPSCSLWLVSALQIEPMLWPLVAVDGTMPAKPTHGTARAGVGPA